MVFTLKVDLNATISFDTLMHDTSFNATVEMKIQTLLPSELESKAGESQDEALGNTNNEQHQHM